MSCLMCFMIGGIEKLLYKRGFATIGLHQIQNCLSILKFWSANLFKLCALSKAVLKSMTSDHEHK